MKRILLIAYLGFISLLIALPVQLAARAFGWLGFKFIKTGKALEDWKYRLYVSKVRPLFEKVDFFE